MQRLASKAIQMIKGNGPVIGLFASGLLKTHWPKAMEKTGKLATERVERRLDRSRETCMAKISVFGIGYTGTVSAACLADQKHEVVAVDIDPAKVEAINVGRTPIV